MKHCFKLITAICFFTLLLPTFLFASESGNFILIIDPGHGGRDHGASGSKSSEKNINLNVALLFGGLVTAKHPDVKVIYTRKTDKFVELRERSELANRENADLFISIHANATTSKTPYGAETYTLGLHRTDDNLEVAKRENSVILLEDNYQRKYENFDPESSESYIIFEFMQNKYMEQSVSFASIIHNELRKTAKRSDRGVRQAGFLVLRETSMPSVLVELGFISNSVEEAYMLSSEGQESLANSLYKAFAQYKSEYDRKSGGYYSKSTKTPSKPQTYATESKQTGSTTTIPEPKQTTTSVVSPPPPVTTIPSTTYSSNPAWEKLKEEPDPVWENPKQEPDPVWGNPKEQIVYKIQILTSNKVLPQNSAHLKNYKASYYYDRGLYKYTYGNTTDVGEINQLLNEVSRTFPDAFIVRFLNGVRLK